MTHDLVHFHDQHATTTSLIVAEKFGKRHKNVLRDIEKLIADCQALETDRGPNFEPIPSEGAELDRLNFEPIPNEGTGQDRPNFGPISEFNERNSAPVDYVRQPNHDRPNFVRRTYVDAMNREQTYYEITRDGFSLLVMGFTGKEALAWKLIFIAAFNALEAEVLRLLKADRQWDRDYIAQTRDYWFKQRPQWKLVYGLLIHDCLEPKAIAARIGRSVSAVRRAIHRMIEVGILHPRLVYEAIRTSAFARQLARSGLMEAWGGKVRQLDLFA